MLLSQLKPTLGDDYPAVLRQMKANSSHFDWEDKQDFGFGLVVGECTAAGATVDQIAEFFAASGFTLLML